jgi:hypothetical protein
LAAFFINKGSTAACGLFYKKAKIGTLTTASYDNSYFIIILTHAIGF